MTSTRTTPLRVVIAGGGVAGLEAPLALRALARDRCALTLVAPHTDFVHRPLAVAEPFSRGRARPYPLRGIAEAAGAGLVQDALVAVDDGALAGALPRRRGRRGDRRGVARVPRPAGADGPRARVPVPDRLSAG